MLSRRARRLLSNRLVWAGLAGMLVWLADQPTVSGYNPLAEMFWDPGVWHMPSWDCMVMIFSWLVTTIFCHFVFFAVHRARHRRIHASGATP